MEFHVSRNARDQYQFDDTLFSLSGNVIFANFHATRLFSKKMNDRRDLLNFPERTVRAGQLNAMGLIDEILHYVVAVYQEQINPAAFQQALTTLEQRLGREEVDRTLRAFADQFPTVRVYRQEIDLETYLQGETEGIPNRRLVLEELLLLWLANANPAFSPFLELFDDTLLKKEPGYLKLIAGLRDFFETQPSFGPENDNLIDLLRSPAIAVPHSLVGQLEYIRSRWGYLLGRLLYRLLGGLDLIREEEKAIFIGPGPALVYEYSGLQLEPERFSPDRDWMPRVVLLAKNAFVWLDQLSKHYRREIHHLDQIPDEELERLQRWGFTGLWLIGLWERSKASQRIKQLCGNPEAVSSAYSLLEYQIAADLGGYEAYRNLQERAWQRGIRLSSDMVPNHMGIDSRWVMDRPDWFISQPHSPFPAYTFSGPDLSWQPGVGIYLEDHYYSRTDAAVVFKRVDESTGGETYIYHGNDGTSTPWNDTAQLNFLNPEVREAVIQTILQVARMFPIIRFDAAMTLTKKHYQRLWFPEPGTGGAIPSRAEHGITRAELDARMPMEFWREVVDRVSQEVPDTLLLAEAFWLMEGYFVRTLGMHRVYNSAFMNMLRDELNANYRSVMKNTLEFDPEILKRFVNFMNNPDERTAVDQFGKGDKYFGVCLLLATLPGLPMFGHGQIEGFTEKYGMEYYRAYWDEQPDQHLIERHESEIFPLLHRRRLFAEVENFRLYDFFTEEGTVNEDVFAYSNRFGDERGLVLYHNKYAETRGWVKTSVAYAVKESSDSEKRLVQSDLGEGLNLRNDPQSYCIFRDPIQGLEYIHNCAEIHSRGLYAQLQAYQFKVFVDFREVGDNEYRQYAQLSSYLDGRGVPSMEEAFHEIVLRPVHHPYRELVNPGMFRWLVDRRIQAAGEALPEEVIHQVRDKLERLMTEVRAFSQGKGDESLVSAEILEKFKAVMQLPILEDRYPPQRARIYRAAARYLTTPLDGEPAKWGALLGWVFTHGLGKVSDPSGYQDLSRSWLDEWLLSKILDSTFQDLGLEEAAALQATTVVKLLTSHHEWASDLSNEYEILESWLKDTDLQRYLQVNRYQGVLWYNKEDFETLMWWMYVAAVVNLTADPNATRKTLVPAVSARYQTVRRYLNASEASEYQLEKLLDAVKSAM